MQRASIKYAVRLVALTFALAGSSAGGVEPPRPAEVAAPVENALPKNGPAKPQALEEVVLKSGRSYRGLIESVGPDAIKFVQVIRPGTPEMSVAPRKIWRRVVARTEELPAEQH